MSAFKHFFFHRWSNWVDLADGAISKEGKVIGTMLTQERRCQICNAADRRIVRCTIYDGVCS